MGEGFEGKAVLIIGASGGLGESYGRAFLKEGARLLLAGRNRQKLSDLADRLAGDVTVAEVDITDAASVKRLAELTGDWSESIDIIVNATGYDVRKALEAHQFEEIQKSLDTNLLGAILVTKVFLPRMKEQEGSTIVHMGGFVDGRLAFPYYSVDVATRAGIFSFIESMNRELCQEGRKVSLTYFCPNAADTRAEQPYHGIWKEMGISISATEQVALALLKAIGRRQTAYMMGGFPTRFFAKLNALFPKLADVLLLKKYGRILKKHLNPSTGQRIIRPEGKSFFKKFAIGLIVSSFALYAMLPVVPFLPVELKTKAAMAGGMIGISEVIFWVGGLLLGRDIFTKYRKTLNPVNWICCKQR